jgi:flagellar basal-body rod modification protein FlgD
MPTPTSIDVNAVDRYERFEKPAPRGSDKLGKDEFLKLLITQLQHQDPTAPTDSKEFAAQLAQFSTLELMQNSNKSLEALLLSQSKAQKTDLAAFVGKEILYRTDAVTLRDGGSVTALASLPQAASQVTAVVTDAEGRVVRTIQAGSRDAGEIAVAWDGREDSGVPAAPGTYSVRITAADADGKSISVDQRARAAVQGLSFETDPPQLLLGNDRISVSDVIEIKERSTP